MARNLRTVTWTLKTRFYLMIICTGLLTAIGATLVGCFFGDGAFTFVDSDIKSLQYSVLYTFLPLSLGSIIILVILIIIITARLLEPLSQLAEQTKLISSGIWKFNTPENDPEEIATISRTMQSMANQLQNFILERKNRDDQLSQGLSQQTNHLHLANQIINELLTNSDPSVLLDMAVKRIHRDFGHYHVAIYLVDDLRRDAVLHSAAGVAGDQMKSSGGYRQKLGKEHIIGFTGESGICHAEHWISQKNDSHGHPLLADTQSELALPMIAGGRVIGVLDIQSVQPDAFPPNDVDILQTIADFITRTYQTLCLQIQANEQMQYADKYYTDKIYQRWIDGVGNHPVIGYRSTFGELTPIFDETIGLGMGEYQQSHQMLSFPVTKNEKRLGAIEIIPGANGISELDVNLVRSVASQIGDILDKARYTEDVAGYAYSAQMISQAARKIRENLDRESILNIFSEEIKIALKLTDVQVLSTNRNISYPNHDVQPNAWTEKMMEIGNKNIPLIEGQVLIFPIKSGSHDTLVVSMQRIGNLSWGPKDLHFAEILCKQLFAAVNTASVFQEAIRQADCERNAYQLTTSMFELDDPPRIIALAVNELRNLLNVPHAQISILPASIDYEHPQPTRSDPASNKPNTIAS